MARLLFAPAAARDLTKISDDITAAAGERVALSFVGRLRRSIERLTEFPRMGRRRPGFGPGVRSWTLTPYVVFYRQLDSDVEIVRILHGRRKLTRSLVRGG
ncbi:MAG: type II toxin-antitoxin system RelE/ParE family toxin [Hyphomicrobiaceae bacterium]|jgi:toxin ParE1/3/4